jgi:hypothetical protein
MKLHFNPRLLVVAILVGWCAAGTPAFAKKPAAKTATKATDADAMEFTGTLEMEGGKPNPNGFIIRKFTLRMADGKTLPVAESMAKEKGISLEQFKDAKVVIRAVPKVRGGKGNDKDQPVAFNRILSVKRAAQ